MKTSITRLDYKNPSGRGFKGLPALTSADQITDLNEVESFGFTFESFEEGAAFVASFPASYRPRLITLHGIEDGKGGFTSKPFADIHFNTFWTNKTTGQINEVAIAKRLKFLKKLKELTS